MNSIKSNLLSLYNSEPFLKYAITFVLIAIVSRMFLFKQLKKTFKKLFKKQSKLIAIIKSAETNSTDLLNYIKQSKKLNHVFDIIKNTLKEEEEFKDKVISEGNQDLIFSEIIQAKHHLAQNPDDKQKLKKYFEWKFRNHNKMVDFRKKLRLLYSEKFDKNNSVHVKMLFDIWTKLKGNETPIDLVDKKWLEIGFQGPDPSTDFRGAGILALYNLHNFVVYRESSKKIYLDATDKTKWYFFAASGVNISGAIIDLIEDGKLDNLISNKIRPGDDILKFLNDVYSAIFNGFNEFWNDQTSFDFMNFNTLFQKYIKESSVKRINFSLK